MLKAQKDKAMIIIQKSRVVCMSSRQLNIYLNNLIEAEP